MTTATKTRKTNGKKKKAADKGLSLPASTKTIELNGMVYCITPQADMMEWLEDMEDIRESVIAMKESGESVPLEQVVQELGLKLPARRKR